MPMNRIEVDPQFHMRMKLDVRDLQRTADLAARTERVSVAGGAGVEAGSWGTANVVPSPAEFWILITGQYTSGSNQYTWQQIREVLSDTGETIPGGLMQWENDDQGGSGSSDPNDPNFFPAKEINNNTGVPSDGTLVAKAWLGLDGLSLYFEAPGGGSTGGLSTTGPVVIGGGGPPPAGGTGSLTITAPVYYPNPGTTTLGPGGHILTNYDPIMFLNPTSPGTNILGINAPTTDGQRILIINTGPQPVLLYHHDAGTAAALQLECPYQLNQILAVGFWAELQYDMVIQKWRVMWVTDLMSKGRSSQGPIGDQNDFVFDWDYPVLILSTGAPGTNVNYTGFDSVGGAIDGFVLWLFVETGGGTATLKHDNAGSNAINRIYCPGGQDYVISSPGGVGIYYDGGVGEWRVLETVDFVVVANILDAPIALPPPGGQNAQPKQEFAFIKQNLTAPRAVTLPDATKLPAGSKITVVDPQGYINPVGYPQVTPYSGQSINGNTSSLNITTPYSSTTFITDGAGNWVADVPPVNKSTGLWKFSTNTTIANPGAGSLRFNNATPASVTQIAISSTTSGGTDVSSFLQALRTGDTVIVADQTNTANFIRCTLAGAPTNNTGWFTLPVTYVSSGGVAPNNNSPVLVQFSAAGGGGGGGGTPTLPAQQVGFGSSGNLLTGSPDFLWTGATLQLYPRASGGSPILALMSPATTIGNGTFYAYLDFSVPGVGAVVPATIVGIAANAVSDTLTALAIETNALAIEVRSSGRIRISSAATANAMLATDANGNVVNATVGSGLSLSGGVLSATGGGGGTGTVTSVATGLGLTGGPISTSGTISALYQMSVTADPSGLKLVNDTTTPGNSMLYGTNASGVRGWYAQPTGGGGGGTVTSIAAGTGITCTPNPITGTGTVALTVPVTIANGGTGTSTPALVAGTNIAITGTWPNQTVAFSGTLPVGSGGTGTATPALVAGTNVTITGAWPNQTVAMPSQLSIVTDPAGIKLSGDAATPGNSMLYGTNASGVKGWYAQPSGAVASVFGRTGAVVAQAGDYSYGQISGTPTLRYQTIGSGGTSQPQESRLNFIQGANITLTIADNTGTGSTDVTIAGTGGAGGPTTNVVDSSVTLWSTPTAGQVGYMSSTDGTLALAQANAMSTSHFYGVYNGTAGQVVTSGVVGMQFDSGLGTIVAGQSIFLSPNNPGNVTNIAPTTPGQIYAPIGILKTAAGYNNTSGSVQNVLIRPMTPVLL